jgi:large subunit ribosomal protein L22
MTGPKLNEGATVAGERAGTKASARYLRSSASKAREVLDLIRGLDVRRADQVLQFTQRGVAADVRKVLASAVANAVHNDNQDPDELFVLACFADEGPTLRRFRPRARGRATRIRKRSCHITVIVARMSDERLEVVQAREASVGRGGRPTSSAASRRARVERSRQRAAAAARGEVEPATDESAADDDAEIDAEIDAKVAKDVDVADEVGVDVADEVGDDVADEVGDDVAEVAEDVDVADEVDDDVADVADEVGVDVGVAAGEYPGSALPDDDGSPPEGFEIKGNAQSMLYHTPDSRYYKATKAEVYFDTVESAEAAGFSAPSTAEADAAASAAGDDQEDEK